MPTKIKWLNICNEKSCVGRRLVGKPIQAKATSREDKK